MLFLYISDEYAHWILLNVELSNLKVIKNLEDPFKWKNGHKRENHYR